MANYSQQMASALAAVTKTVVGAALARTAERHRSISEILDVRHSFVCGYPQHVEANRHAAEIDQSGAR